MLVLAGQDPQPSRKRARAAAAKAEGAVVTQAAAGAAHEGPVAKPTSS